MNWCPVSDFKASVCSGEHVFVWGSEETSCFSLLLQPSAQAQKARSEMWEDKPWCGMNGERCVVDKMASRSRRACWGDMFRGKEEEAWWGAHDREHGPGGRCLSHQAGQQSEGRASLGLPAADKVAHFPGRDPCRPLAGRPGGSQQWEKRQSGEPPGGSKAADYKVMKNKGIGLPRWLSRRDGFLHPLTLMPVDWRVL